MKDFWLMTQMVFSGVGGWLGYFLGGWDGLLYALVVFITADYIAAVMHAIQERKLSSQIGWIVLCRKVLIFVMVGIGSLLDSAVTGQPGVFRSAVIFFYISNEGIAFLEHASQLGLPIPEKLKTVLGQLHEERHEGLHEGLHESKSKQQEDKKE